jgi:hypothetical protein
VQVAAEVFGYNIQYLRRLLLSGALGWGQNQQNLPEDLL